MNKNKIHTFHIPVMGLAFSVDTPLKVGRFGIDSVIQINHDYLLERMREYYCQKYNFEYEFISEEQEDWRAKRITAYLNLVDRILKLQMQELKSLPFEKGNDLIKYFELLPERSELKKQYETMLKISDSQEKAKYQADLKNQIKPGAIDVNIMVLLDQINYDQNNQPLPEKYTDALGTLRGYANSTVASSVVLSAGFNRKLNTYMEEFPQFYPDKNGNLRKKIVLKVSDYRSSLIQGKLFAKKGLWISEFRVESGLNCGGHAFVTPGNLMGPILEEFKKNRAQLTEQLFQLCNNGLQKKGLNTFKEKPQTKITVQGGIGTYKEDAFLQKYYHADGTGWATPFLLVPEVTLVDSA